jgi:monoamine oxidase
MLLASLAAGASLMLANRPKAALGKGAPRVVIIGAGLGGLSCGYQLIRAGAHVTVVEARAWVGGRVHSLDTFLKGQIVEAGGEFIGRTHATWLAYAQQFGLPLTEQAEPLKDASPIVLQGQRFIGAEAKALWRQIEAPLERLTGDARRIDPIRPWLGGRAQAFDQTSLWDNAQGWPVGPLERHGALTLLTHDLSCQPERMSYLALLASVAAGGLEAFWTEREVFRCASGTQALARALADAIGDAHIRLRSPVASIDLQGPRGRVKLHSGHHLDADAVVLTTPPSTWDDLPIDPAVPKSYRLSTGVGIKVLAKVNQPFWEVEGLEATALRDGAVGMTWQGGGPKEDPQGACLTLQAGGDAAQQWLHQTALQRRATARQELNTLFPGSADHVKQLSFWLWPQERWTRCCTSAPAPGEVSQVFPRLEQGWRGKLFFVGEYASPGFHGRMEGGLRSGALVARRLALRLNLA